MPHEKSHEIAHLEAEIRRHNALYWADPPTPEIADSAYDALVRRLKALAPKSSLLDELGEVAVVTNTNMNADTGTRAIAHTTPMLSLDKCYEAAELVAWATAFEGNVVAMPKFDGVACALHYNTNGQLFAAVTRGDGRTGEDITANAREIRDIPRVLRPAVGAGDTTVSTNSASLACEVRGEIYMRLSVFEAYRAKGMANPRNLAAGAVKQKETAKSAAYNLSFAAYDLLGGQESTHLEKLKHLASLGFPPIEARALERDAIACGFEDFAAARASLDYEIDGVVFKVNSVNEQQRLGTTAHHPRYAIAYKFQGDSGLTRLLDVQWSVARTGAVTPIAIVEPVVLSGVTVTRASLHNAAFIAKLGLSRNAKVSLVRRGGVIPNLECVIEPGTAPIELPETCPSCGAAIVRERDFLFCSARATCRQAVIGQLAHFATALDMLGFGDSVLEHAYDTALLREPADFYSLTWEALATRPRSGEKSAKKLVAEVDKKRRVPLATFLRALGLPELGHHVSAVLAARYRTLEAVQSATLDELLATHGIGEAIAHAVVQGLRDASAQIAALTKHVTVLPEAGEMRGGTPDGPLSGTSFVFTGAMRTHSRSDLEKRVRALGGAVLSSVSKTLTYLVVGSDPSKPKSTKEKAAEKAIAAGATITILSENELLAKLDATLEPETNDPKELPQNK